MQKNRKPIKRRQNVKSNTIMMLALLIAIAAIVVYLVGGQNTIKDVKVNYTNARSGISSVQDQEIIRASGIKMGAQVDAIREMEESIKNGVNSTGFVAYDSVERISNREVQLNVRERTPAAVLDAGGNLILMDAEGFVMAHLDKLPTYDVVYVTGCEVLNHQQGELLLTRQSGQLEDILEITGAIRSLGQTGIYSELNVKDSKSFYLVTNTSLIVQFYDADNIETTLQLAKGILDQGKTKGKVIISGNYASYYDVDNSVESAKGM